MPLFKFGETALIPVEQRAMASLKIRERQDLQRLLKNQIDVISTGTLVISEEYSGWSGSLRRIDLLGIDPDGTLVVFELKRTEDGGHMDLQGIRYAAMASVLTYDEVVGIFATYLSKNGCDDDAETVLRDHLTTESDEDVADRVRIVLVSADFGTEITTTVLWLNAQSLDIRCVRLVPYQDGNSVYLDVQQIIPIPEASDYTVKTREKETKRKAAGSGTSRDFTKYRVTVDGVATGQLVKRRAILAVVMGLFRAGVSPVEMRKTINQSRQRFYEVEGDYTNGADYVDAAKRAADQNGGKLFDVGRYFTADNELFCFGGKTYAFSNQWGSRTEGKMNALIAAHGKGRISFEREES
jgi:hypothetical protein